MARIKVFGGNLIKRGVQSRFIVATTSIKSVAEITSCSISEIRNYWSETGNEKEISVATSKPGSLFVSVGRSYQNPDYVEYKVTK